MSLPVVIFPSNAADGDIERRVVAYLGSRNRRSFRRLNVESHDAVVTLTGQLGTYYEKQVAQETVRRVAGVLRVIDGIQVGSATSAADRTPSVPNFASPTRQVKQPVAVLLSAD
jgi:osmotically-inducible protein OsmY